MTKYKFASSGRSYATGQSWSKGQIAPGSFSIGLIETMLADGTIVEVEEEEQPGKKAKETGEVPSKAESTSGYEDMLSKELTEVLDERGLPSYGTKVEKVKRLIDNDLEGGDPQDQPEPTREGENE